MLKKSIVLTVSVIVIAIFSIVLSSCQGQNSATSPSAPVSSNTAPSSSKTVDISNFSFNPTSLTVKSGTEVIFTNKDSVQHTVTSDSGDFDSGLLSQGVSFKKTFAKTGEYHYHCTPHPNMKGTIVVK